MNADTGIRLSNIDERLDRLVQVSERQQQTADKQQQSIDKLSLATERLTLVFTNQARDISELRAATSQLVETSRVSQQNVEASNYLAQRNLEAIRDLIQQLKDSR